MTHTPAPWMYDDKNTRITAEDGRLIVAEIRGWGCLQYRENGAQTQDTNGLLIASAPDLLAALEKMVEWSGKRGGDADALLPADQQDKEVAQAMQAIAKANGEKI